MKKIDRKNKPPKEDDPERRKQLVLRIDALLEKTTTKDLAIIHQFVTNLID